MEAVNIHKRAKKWRIKKGEIKATIRGSPLRLKKRLFNNNFDGSIVLDESRNDGSWNVSFQVFESHDESILYKNRMSLLKDCPSIVNVYNLISYPNFSLLVVDRLGRSFREWYKNCKNLWEKNGDFVHASLEFRIVFKKLIVAIQDMHSRDMFHGNITKDTVRVTESNEVQLIELDVISLGLADGIRRDMDCLRDLVMKVVKQHEVEEELPEELKIFFELHNMIPDGASSEYEMERHMKNISFFIFNSPLFWDCTDRFLFIHKAATLRSLNTKEFETSFKMSGTDAGPACLDDWKTFVPSFIGSLHFLQNKGGKEEFSTPGSSLEYLRAVFAHYQDGITNSTNKKKRSGNEVTSFGTMDVELQKHVHPICPRIYYAIASGYMRGETHFPNSKSNDEQQHEVIEYFKRHQMCRRYLLS
ncbi:uncharacterized protein LOC111317320 [Durio zibethinus]|uniref:Uncharacterized protein LOC111317320 n=1 Tax=Durio zibethinus TaxID=66656 RepID=A0A6P6BEN9_DURZI|nr:uncharacterized protein LOC111317320 [Durio zibethinus]